MLQAKVIDASGNGRGACVETTHALRVAGVFPDLPPVGEASRYRYFQGVLGSTGLDSGTVNQNVNGSSTAQTFYVESHPDYDIHIMRVLVLIADSAVVHSAFGNVSALSTGFDVLATELGVDTYLIEKAKTGGQVLAQAGFFANFGTGAESHELVNWTGNQDAQACVLDLGSLIPDGLRIGRGTKDRLSSVVNDNLTGLTELTVRVYGHRRYPA